MVEAWWWFMKKWKENSSIKNKLITKAQLNFNIPKNKLAATFHLESSWI